LEGIWKEAAWPNLRYCPGSGIDGLRIKTKILVRMACLRDEILNLEPLDYGTGVPVPRPPLLAVSVFDVDVQVSPVGGNL
jgi:hypothetical protein